jgi:omega-amidase
MTSSSSSSPLDNKEDLSVLRVALCQFHVTDDKNTNEETARTYLSRAKEKGARMAVLPEIWNSPYATSAFPEYAERLPDIGDGLSSGSGGEADADADADADCDSSKSKWSSSASRLLMNVAKDLDMWIVGGSVPERVTTTNKETGMEEETIYNTCLVLNPEGVVVAKHRKVHLFDIDVPGGITFFESETLSPGSTVSHFECPPYGEIGVGICYDIRFAEYAMLLRQKHDCLVLIYPGAFNMTTGPAHWELLQKARALDNQCFVVTASPARSEEKEDNDGDDENAKKYPHYTAWGHSTVVSPWGDVVATIDEKEGVVIADLDLDRLAEVRSGIPIGNQRRTDLYTLEDVSLS